jgi:hypothetical protein
MFLRRLLSGVVTALCQAERARNRPLAQRFSPSQLSKLSQDCLAAIGVKSVINTELTLQNFTIVFQTNAA